MEHKSRRGCRTMRPYAARTAKRQQCRASARAQGIRQQECAGSAKVSRAGVGSDLRRRGAMRILMLNYEYPPLGGGGSNACE